MIRAKMKLQRDGEANFVHGRDLGGCQFDVGKCLLNEEVGVKSTVTTSNRSIVFQLGGFECLVEGCEVVYKASYHRLQISLKNG